MNVRLDKSNLKMKRYIDDPQYFRFLASYRQLQLSTIVFPGFKLAMYDHLDHFNAIIVQ